jgi:hypothetical protein
LKSNFGTARDEDAAEADEVEAPFVIVEELVGVVSIGVGPAEYYVATRPGIYLMSLMALSLLLVRLVIPISLSLSSSLLLLDSLER